MIRAILACDEEGGVGKDGNMPWPHNSADLQWFKENTAGHAVVMGSSTWESSQIPKPLPKRINVLVTSRKEDYPGAHFYINGDLKHNIGVYADDNPGLITWIIGGANIIDAKDPLPEAKDMDGYPNKYEEFGIIPIKDITDE